MSAVEELNSGDTSPLKGPAPKAQPEDTEIDKNDDSMPLTTPGEQAVQFIPGKEPANGDAKVEIGDVSSPQFVGLGKEELLRYASDPFWVRLRWFLFILFWVLWVAMLAGAIVIIVLAPKCAEKNLAAPEAYYELNVKNFAKDGNLKDLGARAEYLSGLGVSSVIISDVLKKDDGGTVDFKDVDVSHGTLQDFAASIKQLKSAGLRVLMTLVPNHSGMKHEWFTNPEFSDYHVRKTKDEAFGSTWQKVDGSRDLAWTPDPTNNSVRFLQLFSKSADLNYLNDKVVDEMKGVFSFWKGKGVDAFVIPAASFIVEDLSKLTSPGATKNQPQNVDIIKKIVNRKGDEPVSLVELELHGLQDEDRKRYEEGGFVPVTSDFDFSTALDQYSDFTAKTKFFKSVHAASANGPANLRLSGAKGRLQQQNKDEANVIRLLAYTSNASVILHYGDEVDGFDSKDNKMNWDAEVATGGTYDFMKQLSTAQKSLVDNEEAPKYTYPGYKGDSPHIYIFVRSNKYYGLANFGSAEATIDFQRDLDIEPFKSTIVVATPNAGFSEQDMKEHQRESITLPARSAVVLRKAD